MSESDYIPENPFGVGVEESASQRFSRKIVLAGTLALGGATTAYVGSKVGLEVISGPIAFPVEALALYNAASAIGTGAKAGASLVMRLLTINPPRS